MVIEHDGSLMKLDRAEGGEVTISYAEVPPLLAEVGVKPGTILARGKWDQTIFTGTAYAFAPGCDPIAYTIKGTIDRGGSLVLIGPRPPDCGARELAWDAGSVMRFTTQALPQRETRKRERKKKVEVEAKPKPKPRRERSARPRPQPAQPSYYYPSYPQWRF